MKRTKLVLPAALAAAGLLMTAVAPALAGDEFCPMGTARLVRRYEAEARLAGCGVTQLKVF